jgi:5,6-dimethylbenzimidazole synthase
VRRFAGLRNALWRRELWLAYQPWQQQSINAAMTTFETDNFRNAFDELLAWRRDVRRFRPDSLPEGLLDRLVTTASLAPSVGLSQPWRFMRVRSDGARAAVRRNFEQCNTAALGGYDGADAKLYARLKLEGLTDAPEQLAVFSDQATAQGRGLGRGTMPEMLDYSVVTAVHTLWLKARTFGLGVGWVSILNPAALADDLQIPLAWRLVAYLCIGFPQQLSQEPELQRAGWERRNLDGAQLLER